MQARELVPQSASCAEYQGRNCCAPGFVDAIEPISSLLQLYSSTVYTMEILSKDKDNIYISVYIHTYIYINIL